MPNGLDVRDRHLDTIGQLASGLASDFDHLIATILERAERLSVDFAPADPRGAEILAIRRAAEAAATLTQQLLAFTGQQPLQPTLIDPGDVLARAERVVRRLAGDRIVLETRRAADVSPVRADVRQLDRIMLNLAINGRDAMPDGGRLTLEARNEFVDEAAAAERGVDSGHYVEMSVADTGVGIDPDVRPHLFEPFFSTKPRTSGLGLATVYGVVKQSGGHVQVESEVGRGSRFAVYLPAVLHDEVNADCDDRGPLGDRGSETVLLVVDDLAVRSLIGDVLRRRGYQLLIASDVPDALRLAGEHHARIDLLITNAAPAGTAAPSVANALRERRPDTRVLFLDTPFTPDMLARRVRAALEV